VKIVRFTHGEKAEYGILYSDAIQSLDGAPFNIIKTTNQHHRLSDIRLLPPCQPSKIIALGVNYRSHGEEMSHRIPTEPLIFLKPSTSVIGPEDNIIYPESSQRVDYEGELGVVIKSITRNVSKEEASHHILGYTCVNDVTARDLQARDKQWTRSKSFDTFCPIGPCIETELDLIFPVFELVSFISHIMTLLPGDVIATGTTSGIGPMQPGDTVEVKIENIGTLRNYVVRP
jgi:2-keto-4-pentenoate hydratase/2-oxohepta-3-ene-1,7-dioic acid hydratase in catechol pathway